ncbi:Golgi-specific brefeldin A-resistance guanine nucleotide exchange factor 1 [Musca vetustissima]|uniref:Golgi-specific brefeldin A-resistance guanine nucleotide exchange factor 1 n=1 Tax=Musca vetustissima TaxID=27455 RepID=UPI002AB7A32B|nr:Golgi-specific brefeldin A-resistance guanine nucleotide exchange factor 1 [Musca vetustissima]
MSLPGNGIFVVRGEMSTLMTAMRRGSRWNASAYVDEEKDGLMKLFMDLKQVLNRIEDLRLIDPNVFLAPFLEVIRTEETTGAVTSLALSAINKFLSYGLIDPTCPNLAVTIENIADAVTHARFMGTDQSSDGVTLFRVVEVLHTLMRSPEGSMLTNESVCEVMLSCFKICFEPRLNELLRRSAEQALKDMVLLLFMRLPQFADDRTESGMLKKFQMMAASMEKDKKQRKRSSKIAASQENLARSQSYKGSDLSKAGGEEQRKISTNSAPGDEVQQPNSATPGHLHTLKAPPLATTPATPAGNIVDLQGKITQTPTSAINIASAQDAETNESIPTDQNAPLISVEPASPPTNNIPDDNSEARPQSPLSQGGSSEYINSVGVRFTQQNSVDVSEGMAPLVPYGLPCIQELFRFLILLCNPLDKQNTDTMMHMGLSLLTVAFEVGADNMLKYDSLLQLVKDDLCRNLFALMNSERLTIFAADLQVCFLMFESMRGHLKFQLESYLKKLSEIIASDNPKTPYEMRELALDNLLQLWRIPNFVTELYINYDCDLYCSDLFESLTNLLSKYTLSATNAIYNTHILAMDTLISVVDNIESNCVAAKNGCVTQSDTAAGGVATQSSSSLRHSRQNSGLEGIVIDDPKTAEDNYVENISKFINTSSRLRSLSGDTAAKKAITGEYLKEVKHKKRVLSQGTELFNQRPDKGIQFLQDNGILNPELDPREIASFLRENPGLDKKMIGEYISKKKNVDSKILMNFVESFDFRGLRVDQALRLYLETFRLPGEAPLIFLVLEHFSEHWHKQNGEPFANTDAAFSLAYSIIMLNMDQHNANAKRLNIPMTQEDFLKNLRGLNGGADYDQDLLAAIYNAIKNDEIIMPAEQTGLVRENYLWKVLLRRGATSDGLFTYVHDSTYDMDIFNVIWGPSLSSLSFMFDKSSENGYQRTLTGFTKCAAISAFYGLHEDFDALILTLCKFTSILSSAQLETTHPAPNEIVQAVNFGLNPKGQAAMRTVFALVHDYGDCLRDGWRHILDLYLQLFRLKLLPKSLMEVEDFCEPSGKAQLILEKPSQKQESGIFSSLYSYLSSEGQREPSYEEQEFIKIGKKCIKECQLDQMIQESKFVQLESLQELLKQVLGSLKAPSAHKSIGMPYAEDVVVFWMEFLVKIVIYNRDRMIPLWPAVRDQMYLLLMGSSSCGYDYLLNRCIVAMLKLAIYLMRNEELCPIVLKSLKMLLMLKPAVILRISKQISIGMYELLKTSAQNIHSEQDWQIVFTILECVGAGAEPPEYDDASLPVPNGLAAKSDGALSSEEDSGLPDRGYTSDSELSSKQAAGSSKQQQIPVMQNSNASSPFPSSPTAENWILVNKDTDLAASRPQSPPESIGAVPPTLSNLVYNCKLLDHMPFALFKCWDSLAFIVRNVAHITPYNFESCVRCIRTFVEACRDGGIRQRRKMEAALSAAAAGQKKKSNNKRQDRSNERNKHDDDNGAGPEDADEADLAQRYETLSIQLLDLMYTLYTRTAQIFRWWAEEGCAVPQCSALWAQGWCPLLQGIARLAMDRRREVRTYAISCLQQRALLVHDLQTLSGTEWASCFQQVLFPLLNELLPDSAAVAHLDQVLLEESRIRTATIMSKVFLHHLTPLIELGSAFNDLWMQILDYIEKFMKVGSDMLSEQMQEILKNMLLVMHSVRVFHNNNGTIRADLWELTWKRIGEFLPNLKDELFRDEGNRAHVMKQPSQPAAAAVVSPASTPAVAILPQTTTTTATSLPSNQQTPIQTPHFVPSPVSLISPVESPRHSIILQPPVADSLQQQPIFYGQLPVNNMPIIVPQQQTPIAQTQANNDQQQPSCTTITSPILSQDNNQQGVQVVSMNSPNNEPQSTTNAQSSQQQQPEQSVPATITAPTVSQHNATANVQTAAPTQFNTTVPNMFPNTATTSRPALASTMIHPNPVPIDSNSFSIELYDSTPDVYQSHAATSMAYSNAPEEKPEQTHLRHVLQDQYNQYYKQYKLHQEMQQQSGGGASNETLNASQQANNTSSQLNTSVFSGDEVSTIAEIEAEFKAAADEPNTAPKVPISHLLAGKEYPSLQKQPTPAIVQSFTPVYVQQTATTSQQQTGGDIYQEYVQNPYNLTLQQSQMPTAVPLVSVEQHQQNLMRLQMQYTMGCNTDPNMYVFGQP